MILSKPLIKQKARANAGYTPGASRKCLKLTAKVAKYQTQGVPRQELCRTGYQLIYFKSQKNTKKYMLWHFATQRKNLGWNLGSRTQKFRLELLFDVIFTDLFFNRGALNYWRVNLVSQWIHIKIFSPNKSTEKNFFVCMGEIQSQCYNLEDQCIMKIRASCCSTYQTLKRSSWST